MPVSVRRINGKFRIVEPGAGISTTPNGKPRDGGGHATRSQALAQMRAMNANTKAWSDDPDGTKPFAPNEDLNPFYPQPDPKIKPKKRPK